MSLSMAVIAGLSFGKGAWELAFFSHVLVTRFEPSCVGVIYQVILTLLCLYFRTKNCKEVGGINQIMQLWTTLSHGCQRWVPSSIVLREGAVARDLCSENGRQGPLPGNTFVSLKVHSLSPPPGLMTLTDLSNHLERQECPDSW